MHTYLLTYFTYLLHLLTSLTYFTYLGGIERRVAGDGHAYTLAQFVDYYGGVSEWDRAPRMAPCMAPSAAAAAGGGKSSLDFVVVAMLQGNDYLPKLRGAQLARMWAKLVALRRAAYVGQHLLAPQPNGSVLLNVPMFLALVGTSCASVADASEVPAAEGKDAGEEESEEEEEEEGGDEEGGGEEVGWGGRRARCDVDAYVRTLLWCAHTYLAGGQQLDYGVSYRHPAAPTAAQLRAHFASAVPGWPRYEPPPPHVRGAPLRPDAFAMALLPAAAQPYVPAPLQPLMSAGHDLADLYHASPPPVWRADLVPRICAAVGAVGKEEYGAEEAESITVGAVRVYGMVQDAHAHVYGMVHDDRRLTPLRTPPPPPAGGQPLRNAERVGVMSLPTPNEDASGMERWVWTTPPPAAGPPAPSPPTLPPTLTPAAATPVAAVPFAAMPPPTLPPSGGAAAPENAGMQLLSMLQALSPPLAPQPVLAAAPQHAGAQLLAMLQPQAHDAPPPPPPPPSTLPAAPQNAGAQLLAMLQPQAHDAPPPPPPPPSTLPAAPQNAGAQLLAMLQPQANDAPPPPPPPPSALPVPSSFLRNGRAHAPSGGT